MLSHMFLMLSNMHRALRDIMHKTLGHINSELCGYVLNYLLHISVFFNLGQTGILWNTETLKQLWDCRVC